TAEPAGSGSVARIQPSGGWPRPWSAWPRCGPLRKLGWCRGSSGVPPRNGGHLDRGGHRACARFDLGKAGVDQADDAVAATVAVLHCFALLVPARVSGADVTLRETTCKPLGCGLERAVSNQKECSSRWRSCL